MLLKDVNDRKIEMTLLGIGDGELITKIEFEGINDDIEFLEQFNEKILIKVRGKPLKIYNVSSLPSDLVCRC